MIIVPGPAFLWNDAQSLCKKLKAELISINTEEDFQEAGMYFRALTDDYANNYGNIPVPSAWHIRWAFQGGGVDSYVALVRNRTKNDNTDKFYDYLTGKENEYLRWWNDYNLPKDHDVGVAIYIRGYLQHDEQVDITADWWQQ